MLVLNLQSGHLLKVEGKGLHFQFEIQDLLLAKSYTVTVPIKFESNKSALIETEGAPQTLHDYMAENPDWRNELHTVFERAVSEHNTTVEQLEKESRDA